MNNTHKQILSIVTIIIFIGVMFFLLKDSSRPVQKNPVLNENTLNADFAEEDHVTGNPDARIIIVEYSDTECPFCKIFHATMQRVVENNNGDVAWVYRHYPLVSIHPKAFKQAEATECAWEQGGDEAFWKYTNRIFEITPSNNGLEEEELSSIAGYVGLNVPAFESCLTSGKFAAKVDNDIQKGVVDGAEGTPFSLIIKDGKVVDTIEGAAQYADVMQRINKLK